MTLLFLSCFAQAEEKPQEKLEAIQQQIDASAQHQVELENKAQDLAQDVASVRKRLVEASKSVEKTRAELDDLEDGLTDLEGAAARRAVQLAQRRREMAGTLALLQRVALTPPAAQLMMPATPLERIRTDIQLQAILPELQAKSAELAATVNDLRQLRQTMESRRRDVKTRQATLAHQQADLDDLMKQRAAQLAATRKERAEEEQRATRLAAQAADLQDLIKRLEDERRRPKNFAKTPDAEGGEPKEKNLSADDLRHLPVQGVALVQFGERDSLGNLSKGVTLRSKPGASVTAVAAGRIAFAGPFRGYGRILIIEHSGGYHTVMAGLATVSVEVGQRVAAGEPLGVMGAEATPPPQLYFEVRHSGEPVNPLGTGGLRLISDK